MRVDHVADSIIMENQRHRRQSKKVSRSLNRLVELEVNIDTQLGIVILELGMLHCDITILQNQEKHPNRYSN